MLLGTAGGPAVKKPRAQPANAVIVNDAIYIVDAGDGVVRQMTLADLHPRHLRAVFLTHHHSDHKEYGMKIALSGGLMRPYGGAMKSLPFRAVGSSKPWFPKD